MTLRFHFQIEVRRCAVFNEDLSGGSWDATHCTTVLTEQTNTVCECAAFGTVAVIIEHVQPPEVDEEFTWLWITKYAGFSLSLLLLLIFVLVIGLSPLLWCAQSQSTSVFPTFTAFQSSLQGPVPPDAPARGHLPLLARPHHVPH